jgi:ribosomal protein S18 acetylase RimI-like enzyme
MVLIRKATHDDMAVLAALNRDVQQLHVEAMPDIYKPVNEMEFIVDDFENRVLSNPDGWVFLAEIDGEAVGYVYVFREQRPESPYTYARDYLTIDQISVKPVYQGMGAGRALVEAVSDLARSEQVNHLRLSVMAFNTAAVGFYANLGFEMYSHRMAIDLEETEAGV